jgi:hypothetical protein
MRPKTLLLLLTILLFAGKSMAQSGDASVTLSADRDHIVVGDEARIIVDLQHNPSLSSVTWPSIPDSFGKLEILRKDKIDTIKNGSFVLYHQVLFVTGFDSGVHVIPPVTAQVQPKNGAPYQIQSGGLDILVQTVAVDTTKAFKPIKEIILVKSSWLDYIWWIVGGLLLLIAAIALFLYFKKNKPVAAPPPAPSKPLHIRYLEALDKLEAEKLWQKGDIKEYYIRLTELLRQYIETRFGVATLERTTGETMDMARKHPELCKHTQVLNGILSTADMAKFARAQPLPSEHAAAMQLTRAFIKDTAAVEAVTQPAS